MAALQRHRCCTCLQITAQHRSPPHKFRRILCEKRVNDPAAEACRNALSKGLTILKSVCVCSVPSALSCSSCNAATDTIVLADVSADGAVEAWQWPKERGWGRSHCSQFICVFLPVCFIKYFDVISAFIFVSGGKTPDPNKRSYADVLAEARLRAEEVSYTMSCILQLWG